jgi:hypothetical protein
MTQQIIVDVPPETPDLCPTCRGEGWLMDSEGEPCPDCLNPLIIGGTGLNGGALTEELRQKVQELADGIKKG